MLYIFNPGDGCDVETSSNPTVFRDRVGDRYRVRIVGTLEYFDRVTSNWYSLDSDALSRIQIKVLRAAGLHP